MFWGVLALNTSTVGHHLTHRFPRNVDEVLLEEKSQEIPPTSSARVRQLERPRSAAARPPIGVSGRRPGRCEEPFL